MSAVPASKAVRRAPLPRPASAPAAPGPAPTRTTSPAHAPTVAPLRLVAAPVRPRGFVLYVAACLTLLVSGSATVLCLNTALAQGAFQIHAMEAELSKYQTQKEAIEENLTALAEPAALSVQARALGMVPSHATGYIVLKEGKVIGDAPAAAAPKSDAAPDGTAAESTVAETTVTADADADAAAAGAVTEDTASGATDEDTVPAADSTEGVPEVTP